MNYYTIRILSATRSYINGESQYSKGQKDASAYLINYIYLENEADYIAFKRSISIPEGDHIARIALSAGSLPDNKKIAARGFLQGKNHPEDIDDLIWLFSSFQHLSMLEKVIGIWKSGDDGINNLHQLGVLARQKITAGKISADEKKALILAISDISADLTIKEQAFSDSLGVICREINLYIFIANVLIILVIVVSSLAYAVIMITNLANSKKKIVEQNDSLQAINAGLDKFVFNLTHDLRSPLVSLVGLIDVIVEETDVEQIKTYTLLMKDSLVKQDLFINEMMAFIKSKDLGFIKKECSLAVIVDNVITQNHYRNDGKKIQFYKEVELNNIDGDALKLQVVLNNLVSNSIKYSDAKKESQWVKVKTYQLKNDAVIEVEDNGLGIRQKDQERIFDKFYLSGNNKRSSGIGLYLVKDAVTQMSGRIEVNSELGLYSKFIISIPI